MAALWGFAAGQQAAQQGQQRQQMVNIATEEAPLRMQAMATANKLSTLALQRQQFFNTAMEQHLTRISGGAQGSDTLGTQLHSMAELALESGNPQMAAKYVNSLTSYERNKSTIADNMQKLAIAHAGMLDKLMQNVHDDTSWRAANMAYMMQTGQKSPFAHIPYEVAKQNGLLDQIQAATMSAVKKAQINQYNARAKAESANTALAPLRQKLIEKQISETEARTAHLGKEGVTHSVKATNDNLKILTDLANKAYSVDPTRQAALRAVIRPWAEKMIEIERQNPDMTPTQAAAKAFLEARQAHTFAGFRDYHAMPGGSVQTAIPYKGDPKTLQDNTWYQTNQGPLLFQKGKFYTEQEVKSSELQ